MENPEVEIVTVKPPTHLNLMRPLQEEIVSTNDFSNYRAERRREMLRQKMMEAEAQREVHDEDYHSHWSQIKQQELEKTKKRRLKRKRKFIKDRPLIPKS